MFHTMGLLIYPIPAPEPGRLTLAPSALFQESEGPESAYIRNLDLVLILYSIPPALSFQRSTDPQTRSVPLPFKVWSGFHRNRPKLFKIIFMDVLQEKAL